MEKTKIHIDDCSLTVRLENLLRHLGIYYLNDLEEITAHELLKYRSVGRRTLLDIRKMLASYGLRLKGDYLADSEAEKKLIQDLPKTIDEMVHSLNDLSRKVNFLCKKLDELHCNMQPLNK